MQIIRPFKTTRPKWEKRKTKWMGLRSCFATSRSFFLVSIVACFIVVSAHAETALEIFHHDIEAGIQLDLSDSLQSRLLHYYVLSKRPAFPTKISSVSKDIVLFELATRSLLIPKKVLWAGRRIQSSKTVRGMRVRPMSQQESALRGYWGGDCSTETRLLRPLQPGHVHLAIERANGETMGQVELVLGVAAGGMVAFLERFQIPRRMNGAEVRLILLAIHQILSEQNRALLIPEEAYKDIFVYGRMGHVISNRRKTQDLLVEAITRNFETGRKISSMQLIPDAFVSPYTENFVLIARRLKATSNGLIEILPNIETRSLSSLIHPEVLEISGVKHNYPMLVSESREQLKRQLTAPIDSADTYDCPESLILPEIL